MRCLFLILLLLVGCATGPNRYQAELEAYARYLDVEVRAGRITNEQGRYLVQQKINQLMAQKQADEAQTMAVLGLAAGLANQSGPYTLSPSGRQPLPTPGAFANSPPAGMFQNEQVIGLNKVCLYNQAGSAAALTVGAAQACPINPTIPYGLDGGAARGAAFLKGEQTSGINKLCFYDRMGSVVATTMGAAQLCPISLP